MFRSNVCRTSNSSSGGSDDQNCLNSYPWPQYHVDITLHMVLTPTDSPWQSEWFADKPVDRIMEQDISLVDLEVEILERCGIWWSAIGKLLRYLWPNDCWYNLKSQPRRSWLFSRVQWAYCFALIRSLSLFGGLLDWVCKLDMEEQGCMIIHIRASVLHLVCPCMFAIYAGVLKVSNAVTMQSLTIVAITFNFSVCIPLICKIPSGCCTVFHVSPFLIAPKL